MNILHIDASASESAVSHTRRLSSELVERLKTANPDATIVYRDLVANQLPHVDMTIRHAWTAENTWPPLTTVKMPTYELGRAAVRALHARLSGGTGRDDVVADPPPRLVLRESTAPPR